MKRLRLFPGETKNHFPFVFQFVFLDLFYYSPDFKILRSDLSVIRVILYMPIEESFEMYPSDWEKFANEIISDPSHLRNNDISECRSHVLTSVCINILETVPYLARIPTS